MRHKASEGIDHLEQLHALGGALGAVILAGGLSRRMGGIDKGMMPLAGKPMIAHVLDTIRPVVDATIINANRNVDQYGGFGVAVHSDAREGHLGPLAGLSTGLAILKSSHVFMCPCDSPFIEAALVSRLVLAVLEGDHDVAVAADEARMQPVFCVVNRRVESSLNGYLDRGERKIDRWFDRVDSVSVDCADLDVSFRNINTEEERQAAEKTLEYSP